MVDVARLCASDRHLQISTRLEHLVGCATIAPVVFVGSSSIVPALVLGKGTSIPRTRKLFSMMQAGSAKLLSPDCDCSRRPRQSMMHRTTLVPCKVLKVGNAGSDSDLRSNRGSSLLCSSLVSFFWWKMANAASRRKHAGMSELSHGTEVEYARLAVSLTGGCRFQLQKCSV